jgi:2',3'-cyclic-nucleotide 2'-phosphodiesterase (5'-nucleotidase family)
MPRLLILHSNDVHGRIEGLARIATLVERARAEAGCPVLYLDAGDVEETTTHVSNITKGAAMHRLLSAAGCDAAAVGNAAWLRYGTAVVAEHGRVARYPLLCANLEPVPGARPSVVLEAGGVRVGVVGVTAPFSDFLAGFDYGIEALDVVPLVRRLAAELRAEGADLVVVLSHLGLERSADEIDDVRLAGELQGEVELIVGAHSHDLLPEGRRVGNVLIVQAGELAQHLGRVEVGEDGLRTSVEAVSEDVPPHPGVLAEEAAIEPEAAAYLDEVVGELDEPLDLEAAARWLAEVLRERMDADVGLVTPGQAFTSDLPGGVLRRGDLWRACDSSANPGVATMTGAQLCALLERGRDPDFARTTARPLRGRERGVLQVSPEVEPEPGRTYRVAASDWELEPYGGLVEAAWELRPRYDFPTILREAIEENLAGNRSSTQAASSGRRT